MHWPKQCALNLVEAHGRFRDLVGGRTYEGRYTRCCCRM